MAERSKALRSGRSRVLPAWVRIPLLTISFAIMITPSRTEDLKRCTSTAHARTISMVLYLPCYVRYQNSCSTIKIYHSVYTFPFLIHVHFQTVQVYRLSISQLIDDYCTRRQVDCDLHQHNTTAV